MIRKSAKNVSPRKGHALSRPPSGGLTCSEPQVEDILSAGESTEEERIYPAKQIEPRPIASSLGGSANDKLLWLRSLNNTTAIEQVPTK